MIPPCQPSPSLLLWSFVLWTWASWDGWAGHQGEDSRAKPVHNSCILFSLICHSIWVQQPHLPLAVLPPCRQCPDCPLSTASPQHTACAQGAVRHYYDLQICKLIVQSIQITSVQINTWDLFCGTFPTDYLINIFPWCFQSLSFFVFFFQVNENWYESQHTVL